MRFQINGTIHSLNAAALLLGAAGLLSRILGILRDRLLASEFGAGRELDLYYAAFQIPDLMVMLFVLGAGSAAILPIFQEYFLRDREDAKRLISDLSSFFLAGSILVAALAFAAAPFLIELIAPGFSAEEKSLTSMLTRLMLFSPIFFGLSGIFSSVVQSFQRFFVYALAPLLYNLGIIIGILFFVPIFGILGLGWGVILGSLLHLGIHWWTVKELGFSVSLGLGRMSDGVRRVLGLSFPRVLALSLSQLTGIVLIAFGSTLAEGSIAVFQLSQNLYFMPVGIFGISYAVALFPRLSRAYIAREAKVFFDELHLGIRSILFWIMPTLTLFIVLRAHIVRVALGAGQFSWEDTRLTAALLAIFSLSLLINALMSLLIKGFYALENTRRPLFINLVSSLVSVASAFYFVKLFGGGFVFSLFLSTILRVADLSDVRVMGLATGFTLGSFLNGVWLYWALKNLARERLGKEYGFPRGPLVKIFFSSLLAGGTAYLVRISFAETLPLISFTTVLLQGALAGLAGFAVYFAILFILREEDVYSLWQLVRGRFFRLRLLPQHWDGEPNSR